MLMEEKGNGARAAGSHTGSRAPGQRSLMHPERGWERAPKHSLRICSALHRSRSSQKENICKLPESSAR